MGDVITLAVNMNKKGFEKGCAELRGAINSLSKTAGKMGGSIKKIIPSIIGVGSAYQIITKAVSTFMSQNEQLSNKMNSVWTAFGNLLGPLIERVIGWVTTAVSYLLSFLKLLGVTGKTASQLSKSAKQSGSDLKKTIAGFDELNTLQDNSGSGNNAGAGLQDLEPPDWIKNLADLLKGGQFAEAGRQLAAKLNEMVDSIDWAGVGQKIAYYFKGAIDFLANALREFDFHNLGQKFATMINQILHLDSSEENTWRNFGELLAAKFTIAIDFLGGVLEDLDWEAFATAVSDGFMGFVDAITESIENVDWQKIGDNIATFVASIDWIGVIESIAHGIGALAGGLLGLLVGFFDEPVLQIGEWLANAFDGLGDMTWDGFCEGLKNAAIGIWEWINEHLVSPFLESFKKAFGINTDSTALATLGRKVIKGFLNGCQAVWTSVTTWLGTAKQNVVDKFTEIKTGIEDTFEEAWETIKTGASSAWEGVKEVFGTVASFFQDTFSTAWAGVVSVFSTGGEIFVNIRDGILTAFKTVVNKLIDGINTVIAIPFQGIADAINSVASVSFFDIQPFGFLSGFTIGIPQIPHLAKGGVLKKGQVGFLEGDGAEAVVPLEKNTEWINKMADAFLLRLKGGDYDLTGNGKFMSALTSVAEKVSFRMPAVAQGTVVPYSVDSPRGNDNPGGFDPEVIQALMELIAKMDDIRYLLENMQFVADFGDNIRALARKITKEQRRDLIAEGR